MQRIPVDIPRDTSTPHGNSKLGKLPEWDLSDLYESPDVQALQDDLDWLSDETKDFAASYEGNLSTANGYLAPKSWLDTTRFSSDFVP